MMILDDYFDAAGEGATKVNNMLGGLVILAATIVVIFLLFPFWCLEKLCTLLK